MTLREVIEGIGAFDEDGTIFVAEPWTEYSHAIVRPSVDSTEDFVTETGERLAYFLEVFIVRELLEGWARAVGRDFSVHERCERTIHYAIYDA